MADQQENQGGAVLGQDSASASPAPAFQLPSVSQAERGWAAAVHVVSLFAPLWGPLIGGIVAKGRSRYVEVHAWKALKEYFLLSLAYLIYGAISITFFLVKVYQFYQNDWQDIPWVQLILRFAVGWVIFFLIGIVLFILNVLQAWRAWQGEWPKSEIKKAARDRAV